MNLLRGLFKLLLWIAIPIVVILAILKILYVDVVTIGHSGMVPTLMPGDQALVWRGATIERGDVALCRHPTEEGRYVMARALGMPGGSIGVERGLLVLDGDAANHDVRGHILFVDPTHDGVRREVELGIENFGYDEYWYFDDEHRALRIRPIAHLDGIYLLGDNRSELGEDSREFGVVYQTECIGEVFLRLSPGAHSVEGVPHGWLDLLGP